MKMRVVAAIAAVAMIVSGCTSTRQFADVNFTAPQGDYSLIVMRPNVTFGLFTTSGIVEPREDWTNQAREAMLAALVEQQQGRGGQTTIMSTLAESGVDLQQAARLERLHQAVGQSIQTHMYAGARLPSRQGQFSWTLGEDAVAFGRATGHDYALFLHAQDAQSSSGRVALRVLGFAGCMVGACVIVAGKTRLAFASLVDLRTGQVVWYNVLTSSIGDMRTQEGARETVDQLLATMRPGAAARQAQRANRS